MPTQYPDFIPSELQQQPLKAVGNQPALLHLFQQEHINAINTALACRRPLLITGEPGVGKSQIARAAAAVLGRPYVRHTVDAHTEVHDLLWQFDAISRLAEAQLVSATKDTSRVENASNYLRPGPLWWGFNWQDARKRNADASPPQPDLEGDAEAIQSLAEARGVTCLIDEIDKASSEVANAMLEALGEGKFQPDHVTDPVCVKGKTPLIVFTSNREKTLPDAFLRRCLVMRMELEDEDDNQFAEFLAKRGAAHTDLDKEHRLAAARALIEDRKKAKQARKNPIPGQAEYVDMLYAIQGRLAAFPTLDVDELIEDARPYLFGKADQV